MGTLIDVTLPTEQAEGTQSVMGVWFKVVGDAVEEHEPLLEINTDKVTVEIAAPATGVLTEIMKSEGDPVEPGMVLGRVAVGQIPERTPSTQPVPTHPSAVLSGPSTEPTSGAAETELSPAVRRLLQQHSIDPALVRGSGRGGRITAHDVERFVAAGAPRSPLPTTSGIPSRRVPHTTMRKRIAQHMVQSVTVAPHVTTLFQADLSAIRRHKADLEAAGTKVTLSAYFVRAACDAIAAVPEVNARWHEDGLEIWEDMNIGLATALEETGGLIVPVIHRAQALNLQETAAKLADLTGRARAGTLDTRDVQHGTFTISNHGVSGSLLAAPIIINQPQSAILGIGKMEKRVVILDRDGREMTAIRPLVYVTLTIDHRVLDGHQANRFLTRFVGALEQWSTE